MYRYHIVYHDRNGETQVGRVIAGTRTGAIQRAAYKYGVMQSNVKSAVRLSKA